MDDNLIGTQLEDALIEKRGKRSRQALAAITGLDPRVVDETVEGMLRGAQPEIRLLSRGRLERYALIDTA